MTPIYLSAANPRWTPTTEADLQASLAVGLLEESHYLDLKQIPATKGDNKEAARDLVSFAIDGGTLIYGIAEDKVNRIFALAPQPLNGLAEKIENIALSSLVDPVLTVLTEEIPSDADPTQGYLVVHIPASPVAPHMADGRYYGRNDKTKYVLSDPAVLRLHQRRQSADRDAVALLQAEINEDPIPPDLRAHAHLFLFAQPLAGRRDMLFDLASGPQWNTNLTNFIRQAFTPELSSVLSGIEALPSLLHAGVGSRRSRGAAKSTPNLGNGRTFSPTSTGADMTDVIELQVHEDGGLRLFTSRFSDTLQANVVRPSPVEVILDATAVDHARRLLALIQAAGEQANYFGNWALGVAAIGLKGLSAYGIAQQNYFTPSAAFDVNGYFETTSVSWAELTKTPGAVTRRLLGPLLRALAVEDRYAAMLTDPTPPAQ